MTEDETGKTASKFIGGAAGAATGIGGSTAVISAAGSVSGLSAAGITSGLAAIGGGSMLGGIAVVSGGTALLVVGRAWLGKKVYDWFW